MPRRTLTGVADESARAADAFVGESGRDNLAFVGEEGANVKGDARPVLVRDGGAPSGRASGMKTGLALSSSVDLGRWLNIALAGDEEGSPLNWALVGDADLGRPPSACQESSDRVLIGEGGPLRSGASVIAIPGSPTPRRCFLPGSAAVSC